jgi:hypothetical protein
MLPGLEDEEYARFDAEIDRYLETRAVENHRASPEPSAPILPE